MIQKIDQIINNLIYSFFNLKVNQILKKNLIFSLVNFQDKVHLEQLNYVKVNQIKRNKNMQLNEYNKLKIKLILKKYKLSNKLIIKFRM